MTELQTPYDRTPPGNIIAFSGAHGTGKTTAVLDLARKLKIWNIAAGNIGIIQETSRLCPIPVLSSTCNKPTEAAQMWIFSRQLQTEIESAQMYGMVVSDRTLVDCMAYTLFFGYYKLAEAMEAIIAARQPYRAIFFRTTLNNQYCKQDGFRHMNQEDRSKIENIMINVYRQLKIDIYRDIPDGAWDTKISIIANVNETP
jgi:predicted ATPase